MIVRITLPARSAGGGILTQGCRTASRVPQRVKSAAMRTSAITNQFTESVIREMTRVANAHGAVNLSQGFPDWPAPMEIKEAAARAIMADVNQYAITYGAKPLRMAIADLYRNRYEMQVNPETDICVCCGATEAIISSLLATTNPGDEVIIFEPFYENYGPDAWISGATPRFVALRPTNINGTVRWMFDPDELRAAFGPKTRAIIVNSPQNPTGHVFDYNELRIIADLCVERDVLAITDEIYEFITYDGHTHIPIATLPGMADRTITISGLSKTWSVTGWRMGYSVAPADITLGIRKVHDFLTVGAAAPLQEAGAVAMRMPAEYYESMLARYTVRREFALNMLRENGFKPVVPEGAYYIMADFSDLRRSEAEDDTAFAMRLVKDIGVATVPGSSFFWAKGPNNPGRSFVRFAFCKQEATLVAAAERLSKLHA